jgi:hypothetical protein
VEPIVQWLEGFGLGQYGPAFVAADIDLSVVPDLGEADLEKLGVHRRARPDRRARSRRPSRWCGAEPNGGSSP